MLVLIEQTNLCSLRCVSCPSKLIQRPRGVMLAEDFRRIVDQLQGLEHERVALHGFGDVFLNPDFFENLAYLESRGFNRVDFSSNGLLLTEKRVNDLCKFNCLRFVSISLNSSNKEQMKKINTGSDFEMVVENIKLLIASRPPFELHIQHMVYEETKEETREDFVKVLGSEEFILCQKKLHNFAGQVKDGLTNLGLVDCGLEFAALPMMHWDGDLIGCCGDDTKRQIYGNALRDGIFSVKVLQKRDLLRRALKNNNYSELSLCRECINGQT